MKFKYYSFLLSFFLCFFHAAQALAGESQVGFVENMGQWPEKIHYQTKMFDGNIFYTKASFDVVLYASHEHEESPSSEVEISAYFYQVEFVNAKTSQILANNAKVHHYNYFIGNDSTKWASNVQEFEAITYKNLYPGIDMYVLGQEENLKYEYHLAPHADANLIQVKYHGVQNLKLIKGNLHYESALNSVQELKPFAYQEINGKRKIVPCKYLLNESTQEVSYSFPDSYDENYPLIIDPTVIFSRLSQSTSNNFGFTATYDNLGRAYGGGIVFGAAGIYPTTFGAFDQNFNGGIIDIGISCYHQTTGALVYGTFVGGSDNELPNSMIVNNAGDLLVLGTSGSLDFPMSPFSPGYDNSFNGGSGVNYPSNGVNLSLNGSDIVVFKLSNDGSQFLQATYLGGSGNDGLNDDLIAQALYDGTDLYFNYGDVFRGEVIVDDNDNVYIASSSNSVNYPSTLAGNILQGQQDAIITKLSPNLNNLLFSRFLGGSNNDGGYSMKIDDNGNLFVVGGTNSSNFPASTGVLHPSFQGGLADGYIAKLNNTDGSIQAATYLGTASYDQVFLIDLDHNNNVYVVGQSLGDYPSLNAAYNLANRKQFIHKMTNNLNSTFYSTKFGASTSLIDISPTALLVDICERVYVSGWGGSVNGNRNPNFSVTTNISNMPITSDALQPNTNGTGDFYFFILDKNASGILYGSYFGGTAAEHVDGGTSRFDEQGNIYQAVCASCGGGTFPVSNAGFSNNAAGLCNLGILKMNLDLPSTSVEVDAFPTETGCAPLTVNFNSVLQNVSSFQWDFGDGTGSTLPNPVHTYDSVGVYTIELIGVDSNSCNLADTAYLQVTVEDDTLIADFANNISVNCDLLSISVSATNNYPTTQYTWHMGNGDIVNGIQIDYTYSTPGLYTIQLVVSDSTSCELLDSTEYTVNISPAFQAELLASDTMACLPLTVDFSNSYLSYDLIFWDLGDGTTQSQNSFSHTYTSTDTFLVQLVVIDSSTCNYSDTLYQNIYVYDDSIIASIVTDPTFFLCDSMILDVYSTTENASSHFWFFDNGEFSTDSSSSTFYTAGIYNGFYIATDSNLLCRPSDTVNFSVNLIDAIVASSVASDTFGCEPLFVQFNSTSNLSANFFFWDFGDGFTSTLENPTHSFAAGSYEVMLIASNPLTCNLADTSYLQIEVVNDSVEANINVVETLFSCDSLVVNLQGLWNGGTHIWAMGNGDTVVGQNTQYTYTQFGNYLISYTVIDSSQYCLVQDTSSYLVEFYAVEALFEASDTSGCIPLEVDFNNFSTNANTYWWDTGLNSAGISDILPSLTYTSVGSFPFTLVAIDSASCNLRDTLIIEIETRDDFVQAAFDGLVLQDCDSLLEIELSNQSMDALSYYWDFEIDTSQAENPANVLYTSPGYYTIQLIAENQNLCHPRDTTEQSFILLENAQANFNVLPACENDLIQTINLSNPNAEFIWLQNNQAFSTDFEASWTIANSGTYNISLVIIDSTSCDLRDTLTQSLTIYDYPIVDFITDSSYYLYPDEVSFDNQSFIFDRFLWEFGDGELDSVELNPIHFYRSLYDFEPCLYVWNNICVDTLCKSIYIDFEALLGVPNAFSPNQDGNNDIIYVEGIGITNLVFRIYNRWGELVFESFDQSVGWDGTFRGVEQEMEVYTYVVDAIFIDGSSSILKGNITLLR